MKETRFLFPHRFASMARFIFGPILGGVLASTASAQTVFNVATAQDFQNALTTAAGNGAVVNVVQLANGYYTGNFFYSSASGNNSSLVIQPQPGSAGTNVAIDGGGLGGDLNITFGGSSGNVTVSNITFIRNCGNSGIGALSIAAASGGNITLAGCQFLSSPTSRGMGLEVSGGLNIAVLNCLVIGKAIWSYPDGNGMQISGVTGNTLICSNTMQGNYGWGANIIESAILTVSNNIFADNASGGLYFDGYSGGQVIFSGNVFNANGGSSGLSLSGFNDATVCGNIFSGNQGAGANLSNGYNNGTTQVSGNTFNGNDNGLNIYGVGTQVISGNTFSDNSQTGFNNSGFNTALVVSNSFTGNMRGGASFSYSEYLYNGSLTVSNNTFSGNSVGGNSFGAISAVAVTFILAGNTFTGNSCNNAGGGAVNIPVYTYAATIVGNTFEQNSSAAGGGAIYANPSGPLVIEDNLIVNNTQTSGSSFGGGVELVPQSTVCFINNTVFGNTSGGNGGGVGIQTSGTQALYIFNNIIWGNSAIGNGTDLYLAGGGSQTELLYNDVNGISGVWAIAQNVINVDPNFFNPVGGDFHLMPNSPCLNVGTNAAPCWTLTDLDGNSRTNSVGLVDLGCYEFNNTATHPADTNAAFVISAGEFNSYAAAWKAGQSWNNTIAGAPNPVPIPANYVTRAGYLMTNGGVYTNDGSARPTNWKPAN